MIIKNKNYKSISEVSEILKVKQHVIRYWDSQFNGVSTRLGYRKRRIFNQKNIKKLQILKKLLHTNGKSHHSLEMARKIIEGNMIEKKINLTVKEDHKNSNINKLINISDNLKKLIK
tara:strand:+ start:289 stop:639 length:351 start_codon:yes stop_codon:yes gene_type:complete